jgi:hypothetical protein
MRRRFRFEHGDGEYAVFGQFGADQVFSVVQLLPGDGSGMKILATLRGAESAEQLKVELETKFPGLTGLRPF